MRKREKGGRERERWDRERGGTEREVGQRERWDRERGGREREREERENDIRVFEHISFPQYYLSFFLFFSLSLSLSLSLLSSRLLHHGDSPPFHFGLRCKFFAGRLMRDFFFKEEGE